MSKYGVRIGYGLLFASLIWMVSCGSSPKAIPTSDPTPTPSPRQVIERSGTRMLALTTAHFTLEHEGDGSAQLFPGIELKQVTGEVDIPDKFKLRAEVVSAFPRSFFEIDVVVVGDKAFMTDFINSGKWNRWPVQSLPFDFADLGRTLNDIILDLQEPTFVGTEIIDDVPIWHIKGITLSENLDTLVPAAGSGYEVGLELWIGQPQGLLMKVRIRGQILDTDNPGVARVLTIHSFDEPVEILLPDIVVQ